MDAVAAGVVVLRERRHARRDVQAPEVADVAAAQGGGARLGRGELRGVEPERVELGGGGDIYLDHEARLVVTGRAVAAADATRVWYLVAVGHAVAACAAGPVAVTDFTRVENFAAVSHAVTASTGRTIAVAHSTWVLSDTVA